MKKSILNNKELLEEIIRTSVNAAQVLEKLGMKAGSGNYVTLKKYCKKFNLVIELGKTKRKSKADLSQYFKKDSHVARHAIKRRIIQENLIDYKCCKCGLENEWNGQKISLQLEHKNGINNDNRIENLAFICPNCHSQTSTYAGKNKIRVSQGG